MKKGPFEVISIKSIYKNPWIEVTEESVKKPDGSTGMFGVIHYGKGLSVVPINENREIYLIKEYNYAINAYDIKTPSGGIDGGENAQEAAQRELLEEVGLVSDEWVSLGYVHPLTMILESPAYLFLAKNVKEQSGVESGLELVKIPFDKAYEMVLANEIIHAPSCVAIMKAKVWLEK